MLELVEIGMNINPQYLSFGDYCEDITFNKIVFELPKYFNINSNIPEAS